MSEQDRTKALDCVEMKRRIQERVYAETRGLDTDELLAWSHRRVASSRFTTLFRESPQPTRGRGEKRKS